MVNYTGIRGDDIQINQPKKQTARDTYERIVIMKMLKDIMITTSRKMTIAIMINIMSTRIKKYSYPYFIVLDNT